MRPAQGNQEGHSGLSRWQTRLPIAIKRVLGTRTSQLILTETEVSQLGELSQLGRDATCTGKSRRPFLPEWWTREPIAIKRVRGTRTSQLILIEMQPCQLNKLPDLRRDGTCQRIFRGKLSRWQTRLPIAIRRVLGTRTSQLILIETEHS